MCLAVPAKLVELLDPHRARASIGGVIREISVELIDEPRPGDYVILHVGFALSKMDEAEAHRTLALMQQDGSLTEVTDAIR